ncbi:hypothetical protein [Paenibacillus sp. IITD108]|uniref:hypothetical protein n=1 Tax=Paenibacillus sp. IITD108 TaxID=3116649 RepID=UPI002F41E2DA
MRIVGILQLVNGILGLILGSMMTGDIGIAAMIGAITSLLSGIGFLMPDGTPAKLSRKIKIGLMISGAAILILVVIGLVANTINNSTVSREELLTDEQFDQLYTNAKPYKGYQVDFYARVFQSPDKAAKYQSFQVYAQNDDHKNTIIRLDDITIDIQKDDILHIVGEVHDMFEGRNAFGAKITAPAIIAKKVTKTDYATAFAPAIKTINMDQEQNQNGYIISVDKVELTEQETRIYITIKNESTNSIDFHTYSSTLIQGNTQFERVSNYQANYPEVNSSNIRPGVITKGIIVFEAINIDGDNFTVTLEGSSDNWEVRTAPFTFEIPLKHEVLKPVSPFPNSLYEGKIDGIPLALGDDADKIVELMGEPETIDVWEGAYFFKYPGIIFFTDQVTNGYGKIASIAFPVGYSFVGVTVGQTFDEIQEILGETDPPSENDLEGGWTLSYQIGEHLITFDSVDKNGPTTNAIFWEGKASSKKVTEGIIKQDNPEKTDKIRYVDPDTQTSLLYPVSWGESSSEPWGDTILYRDKIGEISIAFDFISSNPDLLNEYLEQYSFDEQWYLENDPDGEYHAFTKLDLTSGYQGFAYSMRNGLMRDLNYIVFNNFKAIRLNLVINDISKDRHDDLLDEFWDMMESINLD